MAVSKFIPRVAEAQLLAAMPCWFPGVFRWAVKFSCFGPSLLHPVVRKVPLQCLAALASWRARGVL